MMKKVAFVYFDDLHHIHHFIGVAAELSKNKNVLVDILTYHNEHSYLKHLIQLLGANNINIEKLKTGITRQIIDKIKKRKRPSPLFLTKHNESVLSTYNALVFTDFISYPLSFNNQTKFVYLSHGSGDRAYGYNIPKLKMFDILLLAGNKIVDRILTEDSSIKNYKIIGYPKFDVTLKEFEKLNLFNNTNKTVLYNPHNKRHLSSWYKHGEEILEFFYNNTEYNLIFAPHINLFNHKKYLPKDNLKPKYYNADNIHIDLGSMHSSNMSYAFNADIYLGDVSSQVYEFLHTKKPCIFINSHQIEWENNSNYLHWNLGEVLEFPSQLLSALNNNNLTHEKYITTQEKYFSYTFSNELSPSSSVKGANEILNLIS